MKKTAFVLILFAASLASPLAAAAQVRDYLTADEIELVRDRQEIDDRIEVLIGAVDRRFAVLKIDSTPDRSKKRVATDEEWGKAPGGTRIELLNDIRLILQKAIDDLDSLAARPESAILPHPDDKRKKPKTTVELFRIAVMSLASASERFKTLLEKEYERSAERAEKAVIATSIESCTQIIEASKRMPVLPTKYKTR